MSSRQLDDWIDSYLWYEDNSESPDIYKLWTAIFCIAACLKRKCQISLGSLTFYPNLYVVLVGPSGVKKGTAMGPGYDMLCELNIRMAAESTTREALIRELRKSGNDPTILSDGKMKFHSSLSIFSQELSVFLGYNNIQLMSDLTDWYDCRSRWHYSTKDKALSDDVINVWVALFGATTPAMIQSNLPNDAIGLGLTSRIIFVYESKKGKFSPVPFRSEEQEALRSPLLHDLEQVHMMRGKFTYSSAFVSDYIDWAAHQEMHKPFQDERLAGYIERRRVHLLKLCMVLNASRTDDMNITPMDLGRAIEILENTEKKMPRVFSGLGKNPLASVTHRAMQILASAPEIEHDQLYTMLANDVDAYHFEQVLHSLEASGFAKVVIEGRKKTVKKIGDKDPFV